MSDDQSLQIPSWVLLRFPPGQRAAIDHLRGLVDESMLTEIAEADYAQDADKHLAALKPVWKGSDFVELKSWFPVEVLELIRWSEPEDSQWKPGSTGLRGHKMRAFSCAALLATSHVEPQKETLIQLMDSAYRLGCGAQEAVARFLVWRLVTGGRFQDRPFFALALAAIVKSLDDSLARSNEQELADWVGAEERLERSWLGSFSDSYLTAPWLFGLSHNNMRNEKWEALIQRLIEKSGDGPLRRMLAENYIK